MILTLLIPVKVLLRTLATVIITMTNKTLIMKIKMKYLVTTTLTMIITVVLINIAATKILDAGTNTNTKNEKPLTV